MNVSTCKVSVIVPLFNRCELITETLRSVRAQTHENWELLVIDDDSVDGSLDVAYRESQCDARLRVWRRHSARKGASVCRNEGLNRATGEFVMFLDSDDLLAPTCIENRLKRLELYPDFQIHAFPSQFFGRTLADKRQIWWYPEDDLLTGFLRRSSWSVTSGLWNTRALEEIGGFRSDLPCWQDWELHVRALALGLSCKPNTTDPDSFCRRHCDTQISRGANTHPENLRLLASMFKDIIVLLRRLDLLTPNRSQLMVGQLVNLSVQMRTRGIPAAADGTLTKLAEQGLVSPRQAEVLIRQSRRIAARLRWIDLLRLGPARRYYRQHLAAVCSQ